MGRALKVRNIKQHAMRTPNWQETNNLSDFTECGEPVEFETYNGTKKK